MELSLWLSLFSICLLGAMSPGPSLAVVVNATLSGGRAAGLVAAASHGLGVGLYGLLTVVGLAVVITRSPNLFLGLQLAGAVYLLYLGLRALGSKPTVQAEAAEQPTADCRSAAVNGFMVAFLNPKLAVFMIALFSQYVQPDAQALQKGIMALTVGLTDASWYCLIALLVSHPAFLGKLQHSAVAIDRAFGVILVILALSVAFRALV